MGKYLTVYVRFGDINGAIKVLKKKLQNDGFSKALKLKRYHEKPSEVKRRKKRESLRRIRKSEKMWNRRR